MIRSFKELKERVKTTPMKRVALVAAHDAELFKAAIRAQRERLASFHLLGDEEKIRALLSNHAEPPGDFNVINTRDPAAVAVELVRAGKADIIMKGSISTRELLKAVLDRDKGLRKGELLNHLAVIESPDYHKLLFITDGGINLTFDTDVFTHMIRNTADYLKRLDIMNPKFGMMALVEDVNEKIPETLIARQVREKLKNEFIIDGPIAPDVALSKEAARRKDLMSSISGDTDVLVMPNTTAANHLVKGLALLGGCRIGGIIIGARVPIILLSRSDPAETKYRSILLALI